jgi:threonine dehydrogenase-like Zn-dependent dehydrogenase
MAYTVPPKTIQLVGGAWIGTGKFKLLPTPKPDLVKTLGATYHSGAMADLGFEPDIILECTGVGQVISDCFQYIGAGGAICLTGIGSGGRLGGVVADDVKVVLDFAEA